MKMIDLTGQRFGKLTIIKQGKNRRKSVYWLCICDCGNTIEVASINLRNGDTKTCKCTRVERAIAMGKANGRGISTTHGRLYTAYRYKAEKKNIVFTLDKEFFSNLISQPCYYCGKIDEKDNYKTKEKFNLNGLDKVISSSGYVEDNVVSCCWECNCAKKDVSINIARKMIEFVDSPITRLIP